MGRTDFNEDISGWDVGNVISMQQLFREQDSISPLEVGMFLQSPIWVRSSEERVHLINPLEIGMCGVTIMTSMFYSATSFNQDLSNWDMSSVILAGEIFRNAQSFNQPIGDWNTFR